MSDSFSEMMRAQGVRRIDEKPAQPPRRHAPPKARPTPAVVDPPPTAATPPAPPEPEVEPAPVPVAWTVGAEAARIVQIALTRSLVERGRVYMLAPFDGRLELHERRSYATMSELAIDADGANAELVIVTGRGWKMVLHPSSGVATLTEDPKD